MAAMARVEQAEEVIEGLDSARSIAESACSLMQGVLRVGKALPLIGPTCAIISGGA